MSTPIEPASRRRLAWSLRSLLIVAAVIPLVVYEIHVGRQIGHAQRELLATRNGCMVGIYSWEDACLASIKLRDGQCGVPFGAHGAGAQHVERLRELRRDMIAFQEAALMSDPEEYLSRNEALFDKYDAEGNAWLSKH